MRIYYRNKDYEPTLLYFIKTFLLLKTVFKEMHFLIYDWNIFLILIFKTESRINYRLKHLRGRIIHASKK